MPFRITFSALAALAQFLLVAPCLAQSMTVMGGNGIARDCFLAASIASQIHSGSQDDIDNCSFAIEHVSLSQRDLLATYVNRGVLYASMDQYEKAAADYASAVRLDPRSGEVYVNRGNLAFLGKDYRAAIGEYTRALELGLSKDHIAYFNRGLAYEHAGDLTDAEADYRKAAELAPQWFQPQAHLDRLLRGTGAPADPRPN